MKIILFGATGTIGKCVKQVLSESGHEVVSVGRNSGDHKANIEDAASVREVYRKLISFDAVVSAVGEVTFAPLAQLTHENWTSSLNNKLLGQVNLVQEAIPFIREKGSFTLISGILSDTPIAQGVIATAVNRAVEGFVVAAACELPKSLRINVVSPTMLEEAKESYGPFFPGFNPVSGRLVGEAYKKSVMGIQTGQIIKLHGA